MKKSSLFVHKIGKLRRRNELEVFVQSHYGVHLFTKAEIEK